MRIGFVTRKTEAKWGGDLAALYSFCEGLKEIGQNVVVGKTAKEVLDTDFIFLSNTSFDLRENFETVSQNGKRFGVIGFHPDREQYYSSCYGFANFVGLCVAQKDGRSFHDIEQLVENPSVIDFFSFKEPSFFNENFPILEKAEICIATSATELATLLRDSPGCRPKVIHLDSGIPDGFVGQENDSFLQWTGLTKGEYVIQVGRIELRKNQLGTILAMRDLPIPLVFIATESFYPEYELMFLEVIKKWRKAPTLVISQHLENAREGALWILKMPGGNKLPLETLISAYQNAGAHLHPAFCELPGLTYLEAAKLGVPTVASEYATIRDYFTDPTTQQCTLDDRIVYAPPHHIQKLTELVLQQFGKKFNPMNDHPVFSRTKVDMAKDLIANIIVAH